MTQEQQSYGRHAAAEGAERHPLIDLSRDPTPGVPDHAAPDQDEAEANPPLRASGQTHVPHE